MLVSADFVHQITRRIGDRGRRWLDRLDLLASALVEREGLSVAGEPMAGATAVVLPVGVVSATAAVIADLSRSTVTTVTHGDLSFDNLRRRSAAELVAIDPTALVAAVAWEAHTLIRSVLNFMPQPVAEAGPWLRHQLTVFAGHSGSDVDDCAQLNLARTVSSYYAEAASQGDPHDVERLRIASLASHHVAD